MLSRSEVLIKLLNLDESMEKISQQLADFSWDSEKELVILNKQNILNILKRYVNNEIKSSEVEYWANTVESREDIGRERNSEELIEKIVYELANPDLTVELTKDRAKQLITKLLYNKSNDSKM